MKRLVELDILRAWAIVFVVLGHTLAVSKASMFARGCIYSFHMPLFFIISGFVAAMSHEANPEVGSKIVRSAKRLLGPYVVCGLLVVPLVNCFLTGQIVEQFLYIWNKAFVINRFLWYLPSCFILICCYLLSRRVWVLLLILAAMGLVYFLFPCLDYLRSALSYAFPFFSGVYLFHHKEWVLRPSRRLALVSLVIFIPLAAGFALLNEHSFPAHVLRSFGGLAALFPLAYVTAWLAPHEMLAKLLAYPGKNTLFTYCFDYCAVPISLHYYRPTNAFFALLLGFAIVFAANFIVLTWETYIKDSFSIRHPDA